MVAPDVISHALHYLLPNRTNSMNPANNTIQTKPHLRLDSTLSHLAYHFTGMSCDPTQNGFVQTAGYVVGPSGEQLTEINGAGQGQHTLTYGPGAS